ncbi:hypothetical protein [Brevundimonas faecalis]|uniref:Uncharacterized protein n=1 Tax=Brevundimonas faecalis TaxID=947378 RepID=A0ABV2REX8_9CAUL
MTYFCFIESSIFGVPHMEPLVSDSLEDAVVEAEALLKAHFSGIAAHVFLGEERVATLRKEQVRAQPTLGNEDRQGGL